MNASFKIKDLKLRVENKGFTLVELLVVIAILAILGAVAYVAIQRSQAGVMNEKVTSDLLAIENALNQYKKDNGTYPTLGKPLELGANKNILCFDVHHTYSHNCEEAVFVQTQVDNELLTKRYLEEIPTDPRTGSRYAYGVTADGEYFQLAGNHLNKDDTWQAEVVDNLDDGSTLPSLIRSFDGPEFIADAGTYLPYSPDAKTVSGRLYGLTGTVTVDGKVAKEGDKIEAGNTIKTEAAASVAIYFSDGSLTYLDPLGELRLLPTSEVAENDKEGIITKIRLKLFQGKIWNKVVRLAQKSEFNVETTTAIAGVRGTEFGLDAQANAVTVYSGQVVARKKTAEEQKTSNGEGGSLDFSTLDNDFLPTQETNTKQQQFVVFTIPEPQAALADGVPVTPTQETELLQKYYKETLGLSLMDLPYIIKAQAHADGSYSLYVTFNGLGGKDVLKVKGFELYGQSQTTGIRLMKEGELDKPLMTVTDFKYDDQTGAYTFGIEYKKNQKNPFYNVNENAMESLVVRAFEEENGVTTYSQVSWPPVGLPPDPTEEFAYEFNDADLYPEVVAMEAGQQGGMKITKMPMNIVNLDAAPVELTSSAPCVWSIGPVASGAFVGAFENVDKVMYAPLDPALKLDANLLGANVTTRFKQSQESVSIKCEDPLDKNNYQTVKVTLAYKPKSQTANYTYGYFAKNNVSWNQAHTYCDGSTEGGFTDWHLPNQPVYQTLVDNKTIDAEKKNLCELNGENFCIDLALASYFHLQEEQNPGGYTFSTLSNKIGGFDKNAPVPTYGFRCIR